MKFTSPEQPLIRIEGGPYPQSEVIRDNSGNIEEVNVSWPQVDPDEQVVMFDARAFREAHPRSGIDADLTMGVESGGLACGVDRTSAHLRSVKLHPSVKTGGTWIGVDTLELYSTPDETPPDRLVSLTITAPRVFGRAVLLSLDGAPAAKRLLDDSPENS